MTKVEDKFEELLQRGPLWLAKWINHYATKDLGEAEIITESKSTESIYVKAKYGYVRISNHLRDGKPHVAHILFNKHHKPKLDDLRKAYIALKHNAFSFRRVRELVEKQNKIRQRSLNDKKALQELAGF